MERSPDSSFMLGGRPVGAGHPAFVVAEIAQAHDGSLGLAHAFIDAASEAGADAVKFQTHIAAAESTLDEPFRIRFTQQDATRYAYWRRMEFTPEQWRELADHARSKNIVFMSSPFSNAAFELLQALDVPAWKVASGEVASEVMLQQMLATGKPILVSTGMSPWTEIDEVVEKVRARGNPLCLLQCTSRYPTPLTHAGLNVIDEFRARYACAAGLSDHSGTPFPALAAIARGCDVLEAHLTLDRRMFGPDVSSSLTVEELRLVCDARDAFATMASHPVDKDRIAQEMQEMRALFLRSAAPARALAAGTILTKEMIDAKKPGSGIPAARMSELIGRRLARDVTPDRLFTEDDFSG